ncbi:MAG: hypothetical protein ACJAUG_000154 [Halioglobus sp.]|jgi:hypothetical protein
MIVCKTKKNPTICNENLRGGSAHALEMDLTLPDIPPVFLRCKSDVLDWSGLCDRSDGAVPAY